MSTEKQETITPADVREIRAWSAVFRALRYPLHAQAAESLALRLERLLASSRNESE